MRDSVLWRFFQFVRLTAGFSVAILGLETLHGQVYGQVYGQERVIVKSDGTEIPVKLFSVDDIQLTCLIEGKQLTIPVEQVSAIRNVADPPVMESSKPFLIGLGDGSTVATNSILYDRNAITIQGMQNEEWKLAPRDVAWIRFVQNGQESINRDWQEMLDRKGRSGDWLVFDRNGQLDFLEGLVGNITESTIELTSNGQTNQAPRDRVIGIVFFHGVKRTFAPAVGRLRTIDGDEFPASTVRFTADSILLATIGGMEVDIPADRFLEFEASKQKYVIVSKLIPVTVEWKPLVANSSTIEFQQRWNRPKFDMSFESETLSLQFPASDRAWSSYQLVEYSHGIAAKAGTRIVYEIDGEFSRLSGSAGFAPKLQLTGRVDLVVVGDGEELFRKSFDKTVFEPVPVLVELNKTKRLTIQVDYGNGSGFGGILHLCDLKLER